MARETINTGMPRTNRWLVCLLCCLLFLQAGYTGTASAERNQTVHIILSKEGGIYKQVLDSIRTQLATGNQGSPTIDVISLEKTSIDGNNRFNGPVVTVGEHAARTLATSGLNPPTVIHALLPRSAHVRVMREEIHADYKAAAIALDQPVARQLALIRQLLPDAEKVGVLLGPTSAEVSGRLDMAARQAGLSIRSITLARDEDPVDAIRDLLTSTDVILAIHDPDVLNPTTAKWLLYMAYQQRRPVIGYSEGFTRGGALASVFSTPEQIGRHAAELLQHGAIAGEITEPAFFKVRTNTSVASLLGIELDDEDHIAERVGIQGEQP